METVTGSFHAPHRPYRTCGCRFCRNQNRGSRKPFRDAANQAGRRLGRIGLRRVDPGDPFTDPGPITAQADYWD